MSALTCADFVERVTELIEGLPGADSRLSDHATVCWACEHYLGEIGVTIRLLAQLPPEPVPDAIESSLLAAYRRRIPP